MPQPEPAVKKRGRGATGPVSSFAARVRYWPLTAHCLATFRDIGCIDLRDLAESFRRSFREISD